MAKAFRLKVYRTPIGFHDAYVAAPSQKAALAAWGASKNLFARGDAEIVTDTALTAAPLAQPGIVIKLARGTSAEHMASLPPDGKRSPTDREPAAVKRREAKVVETPAPTPKPKPKPRPSRERLDRAEADLAVLEATHGRAQGDLDRQIADLAARRDTLRKRNAAERETLDAKRAKAQEAYDRAMRTWRSD